MRALAYIHPQYHLVEKKLINDFCQKNDMELVGFYVDSPESPNLESRRALGEMLQHLQRGVADCALCVEDPRDKNSVQVRFCAFAQCFGQAHTGVCRKGFIANPTECVFR